MTHVVQSCRYRWRQAQNAPAVHVEVAEKAADSQQQEEAEDCEMTDVEKSQAEDRKKEAKRQQALKSTAVSEVGHYVKFVVGDITDAKTTLSSVGPIVAALPAVGKEETRVTWYDPAFLAEPSAAELKSKSCLNMHSRWSGSRGMT